MPRSLPEQRVALAAVLLVEAGLFFPTRSSGEGDASWKSTIGYADMGVSNNSGTLKSSIVIGFSIIFTIHFGGFPPIFGSTPIYTLEN